MIKCTQESCEQQEQEHSILASLAKKLTYICLLVMLLAMEKGV